jgi:hypothetical protein
VNKLERYRVEIHRLLLAADVATFMDAVRLQKADVFGSSVVALATAMTVGHSDHDGSAAGGR